MSFSFIYASVWLLNSIPPTIVLYHIFAPISSYEVNHHCQRAYFYILAGEFLLFTALFQLGVFDYNWQGLKRVMFLYWPAFLVAGYRWLKPYFYQYIFSIGLIGMLLFAMHTILINVYMLTVGSTFLLENVLLYFCSSSLVSLWLIPVILRLFRFIFYENCLLKQLNFWRYFCWIPLCFTIYSISLSQTNLPLGHLYWKPRFLQIIAIVFIILTLYLSVKQVQKTLKLKTQIQNSMAYIEILSDYTQMLQGSQQRMRILRHDTRHQLLLLSSLLQQHDVDSALVLLHHFRQDLQEIGIWQEQCSDICREQLHPIWQQLQQQNVALSMDINLPHLPGNLEQDLLALIKALLQATASALQKIPAEVQPALTFIAHQTDTAVLIALRSNCPFFVHFDQYNLPLDTSYAEVTTPLQKLNSKYQANYQFQQEPGFLNFHLRIAYSTEEGGIVA